MSLQAKGRGTATHENFASRGFISSRRAFIVEPNCFHWVHPWLLGLKPEEALRKTGCFYTVLSHTSSTARCCNLIKKKLRIWKRFTSDAVTQPQCCCHQHCCVSNSGEHYCNVKIEKSGCEFRNFTVLSPSLSLAASCTPKPCTSVLCVPRQSISPDTLA